MWYFPYIRPFANKHKRPHGQWFQFALLLLALVGLGMTVTNHTAATAARAPLDGAAVYRNNCGRCHMPQTPADLSPEDWRAVSFHMRIKAQLTPREFEAIERFLVPESEHHAEASHRPVDQHPTVVSTCTRCHDTARIQAAVDAGRTEAQWRRTLERMHEYEAPIPRDQFAALSHWLAALAPADPMPAPPTVVPPKDSSPCEQGCIPESPADSSQHPSHND